jgi:hypothetical protein
MTFFILQLDACSLLLHNYINPYSHDVQKQGPNPTLKNQDKVKQGVKTERNIRETPDFQVKTRSGSNSATDWSCKEIKV